jgi:hypothetical protein
MVSKLIRDGEIPTIHFGRAVRVPAAALDEYLESKLVVANVRQFNREAIG